MSTMEKPARIAFVLIDGVGDVSVPSLSYRTPLQVRSLEKRARAVVPPPDCAETQAADVPFLDSVAAAGLNGLMVRLNGIRFFSRVLSFMSPSSFAQQLRLADGLIEPAQVSAKLTSAILGPTRPFMCRSQR